VEHELLAQVVEEVSILAAERRRTDPVRVPRPAHIREQAQTREVASWGTPLAEQGATPVEVEPVGEDPSFAAAIGMLAGSSMTPRVRVTHDE
jgi:hypothetical protein